MPIPTYMPSHNNDREGVERVFGLPEEFDSYKSTTNTTLNTIGLYIGGNPLLPGDEGYSLRVLISNLEDRVTALEERVAALEGRT